MIKKEGGHDGDRGNDNKVVVVVMKKKKTVMK
jgi:hypothetical protein